MHPHSKSVSISSPTPTKPGLLFTLRIIHRYLISIKETGFARIGLFRKLHLDPYQFRFVLEYGDQLGMGNKAKLLVVSLSHICLLLPSIVFPFTINHDLKLGSLGYGLMGSNTLCVSLMQA